MAFNWNNNLMYIDTIILFVSLCIHTYVIYTCMYVWCVRACYTHYNYKLFIYMYMSINNIQWCIMVLVIHARYINAINYVAILKCGRSCHTEICIRVVLFCQQNYPHSYTELHPF